jgi:hypothetical protein
LREALDKTLAEPDMKEKFLKAGVEPAPGGLDFITSVTQGEPVAIKHAMDSRRSATAAESVLPLS